MRSLLLAVKASWTLLAVFCTFVSTQMLWSQNATVNCCAGSGQGGFLCGCWAVDVDALYWKPYGAWLQVGDLVTRIGDQGATNTDAKELYLKPDFDWGYRIGVRYSPRCSCYYGYVSWLHYEAKDTFRIRVEDPRQSLFSPFLAFAGTDIDFHLSARFKYYSIDAVIGRTLSCGECVESSVFAGVRWLRQDRSGRFFGEQFSGSGAISKGDGSQHICGAGPILGLEGRYAICGGLRAYAVGIIGAVVGRHRVRNFRFSTVTPTNELPAVPVRALLNGELTVLSPTLEARLGLTYSFCACSFPISLRLAYEFRTQWESFRSALQTVAAIADFRSVTLGGLVFGISAGF